MRDFSHIPACRNSTLRLQDSSRGSSWSLTHAVQKRNITARIGYLNVGL